VDHGPKRAPNSVDAIEDMQRLYGSTFIFEVHFSRLDFWTSIETPGPIVQRALFTDLDRRGSIPYSLVVRAYSGALL